MSIVHITRVFRKDVETQYGIKNKIGIQTKEHGDKWLSSFKTRGTEDWEEGMEVEVNVSEKGDFLNFIPVLKAGAAGKMNTALEDRVKKLEDKVFGVKAAPTEVAEEVVVEEDDLASEF